MKYQDLLEKLRKQLIHGYSSWNSDEFKKIENGKFNYFRYKGNYQSALRSLMREIEYRVPADEYHYNYMFTIENVVKYTGGMQFLKILSDILILKDREQEIISSYFAEFFYPIQDGDNYIHYITELEHILYWGLSSRNEDYVYLAERFLTQIFELLNALIHIDMYPFNLPDKEVFIKSILKLIYKIDFTCRTSSSIYSDCKAAHTNLIYPMLLSLPNKYKEIFNEIQKEDDELYFLIHKTKRDSKYLSIEEELSVKKDTDLEKLIQSNELIEFKKEIKKRFENNSNLELILDNGYLEHLNDNELIELLIPINKLLLERDNITFNKKLVDGYFKLWNKDNKPFKTNILHDGYYHSFYNYYRPSGTTDDPPGDVKIYLYLQFDPNGVVRLYFYKHYIRSFGQKVFKSNIIAKGKYYPKSTNQIVFYLYPTAKTGLMNLLIANGSVNKQTLTIKIISKSALWKFEVKQGEYTFMK